MSSRATEGDDLIDDFEIDGAGDLIETDELGQQQSFNPTQPSLRAPPAVSVAGGERLEQRRFTGGDTLDEPISATLMRDLSTFRRQVVLTCGIQPADAAERRDWDLWGPLVMSLALSLLLSLRTSKHQRSQVFSVVFSEIWLGQALVAANIKLLGGSIAALHALCITGYALLPIVIAAAISIGVKFRPIRLAVTIPLAAWAIWTARRGLGFAGVPTRRIALAAYPMALFYVAVAWMCVL